MRVVSLLQAWLSIPPKILPEILYTNTSFKSCRCQLYCIIVDSILNRQADYISSSIRLAAYTSMRRIAPLDVAAGQPDLQLINKYHTCLRVALLLQAWLSIPPKILPIRSYFRRKLHLFDFSRRKAREKSGVASQSQAIRLATSVPMRRKAPLGTVAGQPGLQLVIR